MGEQHYRPVTFGGVSPLQAKMEFIKRVHQDKLKEEAARNAGFKYLAIKYDQKITHEWLVKQYEKLVLE